MSDGQRIGSDKKGHAVRSSSRVINPILAPSRPNARAVARPTPAEAPVMTTTCRSCRLPELPDPALMVFDSAALYQIGLHPGYAFSMLQPNYRLPARVKHRVGGFEGLEFPHDYTDFPHSRALLRPGRGKRNDEARKSTQSGARSQVGYRKGYWHPA